MNTVISFLFVTYIFILLLFKYNCLHFPHHHSHPSQPHPLPLVLWGHRGKVVRNMHKGHMDKAKGSIVIA